MSPRRCHRRGRRISRKTTRDEIIAAPAEAAARANDWGTIEGLAPLQPYRLAMGNPQVQEWQAAAAVKAMGAAVPKVASIGATENATDQARYRPGFAPQPWS